MSTQLQLMIWAQTICSSYVNTLVAEFSAGKRSQHILLFTLLQANLHATHLSSKPWETINTHWYKNHSKPIRRFRLLFGNCYKQEAPWYIVCSASTLQPVRRFVAYICAGYCLNNLAGTAPNIYQFCQYTSNLLVKWRCLLLDALFWTSILEWDGTSEPGYTIMHHCRTVIKFIDLI